MIANCIVISGSSIADLPIVASCLNDQEGVSVRYIKHGEQSFELIFHFADGEAIGFRHVLKALQRQNEELPIGSRTILSYKGRELDKQFNSLMPQIASDNHQRFVVSRDRYSYEFRAK